MKSPTSRTTLITAVAVAGVLIAGTAAIAANVGILNASNDSSIGSLSATDDLVPSTTLDAEDPIILEIATPAPTTPTAAESSYLVDDAGTVSVTATPGALALVDAAANPGWTHAATQPDPLSLRVAFDNGSRTVVFTATLNADGTIAADVTEPIIVAGAAPTTIGASQAVDDGQYEADDDDRYESDDQYESDDDEYEDDDSHEYEGADDDD